jgi:amino acid transporter
MAMLTAVNLFGAKSGAAVSTFFSITKLIPLLLFIALGAFQIEGAQFTPFSPHGYGGLANTTMLLLYAFVGFETLVVPAGEMKNPQRAVPTALLIVLSVVCVVYVAVLLVSIGTLPDLAGHKNPVAAASALFMGKVGGTIVAVGIVISVFGTNAGAALVSPRRFYAFAESGDLPKSIAYVHGDSGAPRVAILLTFLLSAGLTLTGTFEDLAVLSVVARFMQYIPTCLAAIVLRYRDSGNEEGGFRLPLGPTIPILAILLCVLLLANTDPTKLLYGCIALVAGVPLYFLSRSRQTA